MRCVILLSDLGAGGTQRLALGLAAHLRDQGLEVELLTLQAPGAGSFFPVPPGITVTELGLCGDSGSTLGAVRANLVRLRALNRAFCRSRADRVVSFLTTTNVLALLAARPLGLPVVVAEESDPAHEPIPRAWDLLRRLTYPLASRIVVHSRGATNYFNGRSARRVSVIPNPIVPCPLPPASDAVAGLRRPLVVATGRLSAEKGFDLLIAAFARIAGRHPDWSLTILGDGPLRPVLERQIADSGLAGRVSLPGVSPMPADTFRQASLCCSAARIEGFGLALAEAMACGLPAVATDAPSGPRDIVRPGIDGELVPVEDVEALGEALSALMADPGRRAAYARRAPEVSERFAPQRVWAAWDALITSTPDGAP